MKHLRGYTVRRKSKVLARIYFCTRFPSYLTPKSSLEDRCWAMMALLERLPDKHRFQRKSILATDDNYCDFYQCIFSHTIPKNYLPLRFNNNEVVREISRAIKKCSLYNTKALQRDIFVFPRLVTTSKLPLASALDQTIYLFINPATN